MERSSFCQESPFVSSMSGSGASTSSPFMLDVESAVCAALRSTQTNPLSEGWGNETNKGFVVGMVCLFAACYRSVLTRQTKPPELLLGFPHCKCFAGESRCRCWRVARKKVAEAACSYVPPSSAGLRAVTSPTCREGGGGWEMG